MNQFEFQQDQVQALEIVINNLAAPDQVFAKSLVKQGKAKLLSSKQLYWVEKLRQRATGQEPPKAAAEKVNVGSFEGLIDLFQKAKAVLKYPKLFLSVATNPVVVSLAGAKSSAPGTINVTGAGSFQNREWYGRVSADGTWTKGYKAYPQQDEVEDLLRALSQNPAKAAKEYGKLSGCCCFCGKKLEDEKSTAAGFGPVCAKNWGLTKQWKEATSFLEAVGAPAASDDIEAAIAAVEQKVVA